MRKTFVVALAAVLVLAAAIVNVEAAGKKVPAEGQMAPTFTLPSQDGTQISLASFRGQDGRPGKYVVLYFYPKDATPGCTIEAHNFQRDLTQYEQKNAVILGVSEDSVDSHQSFCTKEGLSFRLLSDSQHKVAQAYGSLGNFAGIKLANRNTFLIDPTGKIVKVWTGVNPSTHSPEVLAVLPESVKPPVTN
ncbi:MAG: peroxiredoxin [Terracidiphilus sp.]